MAGAIIGAAINESRKDKARVSSHGYYHPPQRAYRHQHRHKAHGQRRAYRNAIEQALLVADEVILLSESGYGFDYLRDRSAERRVKVFAEIRDASM